MLRVALRGIFARKWRLFTTSIAIVLGVAFISGTIVLSDVLTRSVNSLVSDAYRGIDVVIRDDRAQENAFSSQPIRPPIDESLVDLVRQVNGVKAAEPNITVYPTMLDKKGKRLTSFGPPVIATNWNDASSLQAGVLTSGRAPKAPNEVVMDFKTAKDFGFHLGDKVTAQFTTTAATFDIVGIGGLGTDGRKSTGSHLLLMQLSRLQELTDQAGKVNYISVAAKPGVTQETLAARLKVVGGDHIEAITGKAFIAENQKQIAQLLDIVTNLVAAFGYIAVFVAIFVIYNTFSIIIAQRLREMALLRAVGAGRLQLLASVMIEAFAVGLIAALTGLVAGFGIAIAAKALLGTLLTVTPGLPHLTMSAVVTSLVVGIVVSVISALVPAFRATRIPPIAALGEVALDNSAISISRKVFGSLFLALGIGLVVAGVRVKSLDTPLLWVGAGAGLLFVSVLVIGPIFAGPVTRFLGRPVAAFRGMAGVLARDNASRNPKRTIGTAVSLTIGIALVTVIGVMAASFKGTFENVYGNQVHADLIIDAGSNGGGGFSPNLRGEVAKVPGVQTVASTRFLSGRILNSKAGKEQAAKSAADPSAGPSSSGNAGLTGPPGEEGFLLGVDAPSIFEIYDLGSIKPSSSALVDDTVMMSTTSMQENGWKIGDTVDLWFSTVGTVHWKIAATFDKSFGRLGYVITLGTFDKVAPAPLRVDSSVYIRVADGTPIATVQRRVEKTIATLAPAATVEDLGTYVKEQTKQLEGFLNLVYAMLFLAIIVAFVGIVNTLSLSIYERRREIGLLRAVGMSRGQVRTSVRWESVIIAIFGSVLGMGMGIALAAAAVSGFSDQGVVLFMPTSLLVIVGLGGAMVGVVASIRPARRAAKTDILSAIASV